MNLTRNCLKLSAVMLVCAGALVGCGGGGSSSTPTQTTGTTGSVTPTSNLVTSVPTPTYSGDVLDAFMFLNNARQNCGFGLLAQNVALDTAASNHSKYLANNTATGHSESKDLPGFTGVDVLARASAAGYRAGASGETVVSDTSALSAVRTFLAAPYHMQIALYEFRDVGIGFGTKYPSADYSPVVLDFGTRMGSQPQNLAADTVATFPCEGSVGVGRLLNGESPNPVPGRNLVMNPVGAPIMVMAGGYQHVVIKSVSMINTAGGAPIVMRAPIDSTNDPNGILFSNVAYVFPDSPLAPNTRYQVSLRIQVDGNPNPLDRTFSFTTGN